MNRFALIVGSLLPDIVDKPILLLGLGNGRFFSHNLLFVLICFLLCYIITKRDLKISLPFLIGLSFHLILDFPYIPLFYPFISYNFTLIEEPLSFWFSALFTNPIVIITEVIGIIILVFILLTNRLYHIKVIINYLKGHSQTLQ